MKTQSKQDELRSSKKSFEDVENALYKLQSDVSTETERYIESRGTLIRLPMQARNKPILDLINSEVLSVLDELEKQYGEYSDDTLGERHNYKAIPLSAIQTLKERYKDA